MGTTDLVTLCAAWINHGCTARDMLTRSQSAMRQAHHRQRPARSYPRTAPALACWGPPALRPLQLRPTKLAAACAMLEEPPPGFVACSCRPAIDVRSRIRSAGAALPGFNEHADGSRICSPPGSATGSSGGKPVATACCAAAAPPDGMAAVVGPAGSLPLRIKTGAVNAKWGSSLFDAWSAEVGQHIQERCHWIRHGQHAAAGQTA